MGKKDKKKGKGAEKTAAKTEKKAVQRLKRELQEQGEEDLEKLIAEFQDSDRKQQEVLEELTGPPSCRSGLTLCSHPEKDQLFFFGGEYFNGKKTFMYNDLFTYNIRKNQWILTHSPGQPPPRCAHQAVIVSQGGGQMWVFGGEYASPTRSQFHHYRDLWVYHLARRHWEQITAPNGPSARSGHRMIVCKKMLVVFGGFHESIKDYRYFSDVHVFDLETYQWIKVEPVGTGPSPRSGCQMAATVEGKIVIYGGYTREKVKKEIDRGVTHTDMYILQQDSKNIGKWKWTVVRQSGIRPSPRCGFSMVMAPNNRAYLFGGVHDEEEGEELLKGSFYNDLYALDLDHGHWTEVSLRGKQDMRDRKRRRKDKDNMPEDEESNKSDEDTCSARTPMEKLKLSNEEPSVPMVVDDVFTVTIGPQTLVEEASEESELPRCEAGCPKTQLPHPRMNATLAVKHGSLYLYGGTYEDGDRQVTLCDFHCLDLHKLDEWQTVVPLDTATQEWLESSEESEDDTEDDTDEKESGNDDGKCSEDEACQP